jgi:hypothetical protein
MQPHNVENPRPGNGKDPKRRSNTFWLLLVIGGLLAAITVNLLERLRTLASSSSPRTAVGRA